MYSTVINGERCEQMMACQGQVLYTNNNKVRVYNCQYFMYSAQSTVPQGKQIVLNLYTVHLK
jgi:hypothetical protein